MFDFNPIYSCRLICANWSGVSNSFGARVVAPSDVLGVTICYSTPVRCFVLTPVYDPGQRAYVYANCSQAVYDPADPAIVDIPGSNGGRGVPTALTLTVANPASGTVRGITVMWGISGDVVMAPSCVSPTNFPNHAYPFSWTGP